MSRRMTILLFAVVTAQVIGLVVFRQRAAGRAGPKDARLRCRPFP